MGVTMMTTIRKATVNDKTRIMEIYAYARQFMAEHGNPDQWKNNNPSEETIDNDISNHQMYVIESGGGIHAVFYFHIGDDSTYHIIDNGQWLSDEPYGTIHRIASDGTIHGILEIAVNYCKEQIPHLRIDTHHDNKIMQHVIEKNGFKKCGIIYVKDGSERIAYELI